MSTNRSPQRRPRRQLADIETELHREVEQAESAWRDAVAHAIRAGELLLEAKAQVQHGEWLPWLKGHFPGSARSAQGYMRLAQHAEDAQELAHLGVEGALQALAKPRELPSPDDVDARIEREIERRRQELESRFAADPLLADKTCLVELELNIERAQLYRAAGARELLEAAREIGEAAPAFAAAASAWAYTILADPHQQEWCAAPFGEGCEEKKARARYERAKVEAVEAGVLVEA